jgi:hypothetical protein
LDFTNLIMKKSSLILGIFALGFIFSAEGQIMKKIQNAAAQGASNALEKKAASEAEKATTKQLDALMGGFGQPAETEAEYSFSGYMVMEIISFDKKGKAEEPVQMQYFLSSSPDLSGMVVKDEKDPKKQTTMIMDLKNQASIILLEDGKEKSSFAYKVDFDKVQATVDEESQEQFENPGYKLEKTGQTKTILGYSCEEYLMTSEDGDAQYWITEKPIDGYSMFSAQGNPMVSNKTMDRYNAYLANAPKGSFMEMYFTSKDGTKSEMKVIEIKPNESRKFQMSDYPNMMASMNK